jgi:hypothetical protein
MLRYLIVDWSPRKSIHVFIPTTNARGKVGESQLDEGGRITENSN